MMAAQMAPSFVVATMLIKIKQLVMGGANNTNNATLGESQDPVEAARDISAQRQSDFKASSGEFTSGKASDKPLASTVSKSPRNAWKRESI